MRHNKKFNHLGRTNTHRDAMLSNMACSLIKHKRIFTTTAKAKALRKYVEPLITKSKEDTTHSRRVVFSNLQDKFAVTELFKEIAQKIGDRPGGYTRIIKTNKKPVRMDYLDDIDIAEFREIPTYKRMCICILKNDHACKYMGFALNKEEAYKRDKIMEQFKNMML